MLAPRCVHQQTTLAAEGSNGVITKDTKGTKGTKDNKNIGLSAVNNPADSCAKNWFVEVDDQTEPTIEKPQEGEQLRCCDWGDVLHHFEFDDYEILDEEVNPISAFQMNALVDQRQGSLPANRNTSQTKFMTQTRFVC